MFHRAFAFGVFSALPLVLVSAPLVACDEDDTASTTQTDTSSDTRPEVTAPSASVVRVAHFVPDAPAVDFCFVATDGTIIGPVLAGAGLPSGIAYGDITPYLPVEPEVYTVRVIVAGTACDEAVLEVPDVGVPAGGLSITAAALGLFDPTRGAPVELTFWVDDPSPPPSGKVKLRMLHAAPTVDPLDIGFAAGPTLASNEVLVNGALYKVQGVPPYAVLDALEATLRAELTDDPSTGVELDLELSAGTTATAFIIGPPEALRVLVCTETGSDGSCRSAR